MIKKCFTINPNRNTEEFKSYDVLFQKNLFQAIEIFYPYNKTDEEISIYQKNVLNLMKYNIEVVLHLPHGPLNDLCSIKEYEMVLDRFKRAIDYSKLFKVKKLTLHLGYQKVNGEVRDRNALIEKSIATLGVLCDYAYPANIMIENMPGDNEIGYSPLEIKDIIIKTKRDNLKFIFDFGHAHVSEYNAMEYFDVLNDYLWHLHISDNDGTKDSHAPMGSGTIDFKSLFHKLAFYKELYCLEILYNDEQDLMQYEKDLNNFIKGE